MVFPAMVKGDLRVRAVVPVAVLCGCALWSRPSAAQLPQRQPVFAWDAGAFFERGSPEGWVQVRENQIEGTRLGFRRDLGARSWQTVAVRAELHPGRRTEWTILLESHSLSGTAALPHEVNFNGATLAANSTIFTRTTFPSFLQATVTVRRRFASLANGGTLRGDLGLTFVALTFRLSGTLAPASHGSETQEDFVTQELPVPEVGVSLEEPVAGPFTVCAALNGGYLPSINSLRREGGEVTLRQTHLAAALVIAYRIQTHWDARLAYRFTHFTQQETSAEDGNDIRIDSRGISLGLVGKF